MSQAKIFHKSKEIEIQPLDDYSSAFVFQLTPPSAFLIDLYSWLVIELCEGQSFEALKESSYLREVTPHDLKSEADTRLFDTLNMLEQRCLIVST
jgi:hypothetical protein